MTLRHLVEWTRRMLAEQDGTPSSKRVTYVGAFVAATGWLSAEWVRRGMTDLWVNALTAYLAAFTVGYVGGKMSERSQGGNPP